MKENEMEIVKPKVKTTAVDYKDSTVNFTLKKALVEFTQKTGDDIYIGFKLPSFSGSLKICGEHINLNQVDIKEFTPKVGDLISAEGYVVGDPSNYCFLVKTIDIYS